MSKSGRTDPVWRKAQEIGECSEFLTVLALGIQALHDRLQRLDLEEFHRRLQRLYVPSQQYYDEQSHDGNWWTALYMFRGDRSRIYLALYPAAKYHERAEQLRRLLANEPLAAGFVANMPDEPPGHTHARQYIIIFEGITHL